MQISKPARNSTINQKYIEIICVVDIENGKDAKLREGPYMSKFRADGLSPYQQKCLSILIEFDRVCKECGIRYYLMGGTALGAMRHEGFIPWDDDIDVGVPRKDYEKLLGLTKKFSSPYYLEYFEVDGTYKLPFAKVFDRSTTVVEQMEQPFRRGVWIDVFPIDGTFRSGVLRFIHLQMISVINRVFSFNLGRYPIKDQRSFRSRLRSVLTPIARIVPIRWTNSILVKVATLVSFDTADYVGCFFGRYGMKEAVLAEYIRGECVALKFCGLIFPGPSYPHEYLTSIYGDYMTLPPPEMRVPHNLLFVDLENPYDDSVA